MGKDALICLTGLQAKVMQLSHIALLYVHCAGWLWPQ